MRRCQTLRQRMLSCLMEQTARIHKKQKAFSTNRHSLHGALFANCSRKALPFTTRINLEDAELRSSIRRPSRIPSLGAGNVWRMTIRRRQNFRGGMWRCQRRPSRFLYRIKNGASHITSYLYTGRTKTGSTKNGSFSSRKWRHIIASASVRSPLLKC